MKTLFFIRFFVYSPSPPSQYIPAICSKGGIEEDDELSSRARNRKFDDGGSTSLYDTLILHYVLQIPLSRIAAPAGTPAGSSTSWS